MRSARCLRGRRDLRCWRGLFLAALCLGIAPQAGAAPISLTLFPNPVPGGLTALGEVTLAQPAGSGGLSVTLTSSNPVTVVAPASVTIGAGTAAATFSIVTLPVTAPTPVTFTAASPLGSATASLQLLPGGAVPPLAGTTNLLTNGSFEQPQLTTDLFGVTTGVPGWLILQGSIDVVRASYWQSAPDGGNQSIDLDGNSVGTIGQSFVTVTGQDYLFSGYVSHNPSVPYGRANVFLNGVFFTQLAHSIPNRNPDMQWQWFTDRFRATAAVTTLTLTDVTGINTVQGAVLDGLSVSLTSNQTPPAVGTGTPNAPTGLTATPVNAIQVSLTWTDNSPSESAVAVWRQGGGAGWARVAALAAHTTSFTDTGLAPNTTYTYQVRVIGGGAIASDWSNAVTVTTPARP